jgi:hypothetical protein
MRWLPTCCLALLAAGPVVAQVPTPLTPPGHPAPTRPMDLKELIPPLLDALKDSDADVRQSAAGALAAIGREAVAPLLKVFEDKDKDKDTRTGIAFVFGQMGVQGREALPALTKSLKDKEEDKDVRRKAVAAIHLIVKDTTSKGNYGGTGYPMPYTPPGGVGFSAPAVVVPLPAPAPIAPAPVAIPDRVPEKAPPKVKEDK